MAKKQRIDISPSRPERPILSQQDDKLERGRFVQRLTDALINPNNRRSTGVVIGITGQWGSGKSSILNLVSEKIKVDYPHALVVRFDPWLISGRNDLVSQFISELIRSIQGEPQVAKRLANAVDILVKYGEHLAPVGGMWIPVLGPIIKFATNAYKNAKKNRESLNSLRGRLTRELDKVSIPIVVLIDEVDRIEDDEIRAVAQLVRSVADFPGISYALAYDPKRVIQALGSGVSEEQQEERGRAYLEKIVQLQIPIPVTFDEEVARMLTAELTALQQELQLPEDFREIERYRKLVLLLTSDIIRTPRDIARLVGTFHVLAGMLGNEVDWIDLLAYCALVTKAPSVVEAIRLKPEEFSEDMLSEASVIRRLAQDKIPTADRLKILVSEFEGRESIGSVLEFLFPTFSANKSRRPDDRPLALYRRWPLLTTLRLGLLPNTYSRSAIEALVLQPPQELADALQKVYLSDMLTQLIDRLDDLYADLSQIDHVQFWLGVGRFLRKPDCEWIRSYSPMHEVTRGFAEILERAIARNDRFQSIAADVFNQLRSDGEDQLTAMWLRSHMFRYGLFGKVRRDGYPSFLNMTQTETETKKMSSNWRSLHIAGKLIPCRWNLMPVYTMLDTGQWDDECRKLVDEILVDDRVVDGLTLMLYGGHYTVDKDTVAKICSYDKYIERVRERLASPSVHESARVALTKAESGGW